MENTNEDNSQRGIGRRGFTTSSALSAAGLIAGSSFLSPFADAQTTKQNHTTMDNNNGQGPFPTKGMAAYSPEGPLKIMDFERRALGPKDVAIKLQYCGVC